MTVNCAVKTQLAGCVMLLLKLQLLLMYHVTVCSATDCTINILMDPSFVNGDATICTSDSCVIQGETTALISSCSPLLLKSALNPTGLTLSPDPWNSHEGKILLSCSTDGVLTASGFIGWVQFTKPTSVEQTKACCLVSDMARYSVSVIVTQSPENPIDGRVYGATISNCYKVDRVMRWGSVEEVCEGIHRFTSVTNNINVECVGSPGQAGAWANFPGCIPLSGPGGDAVSTLVHGKDRMGGGIVPPSPIHGIKTPEECIEKCKEEEGVGTSGEGKGKFGCVAFAYLSDSSPNFPNTCWLKWMVPPEGAPLHEQNKDSIWNGVFTGTIRCDDGSTLACNKWCDGVADCPNGEDEVGCPEPCNTVHTATNNACGSTLIGMGTAPVEGGKYFQCSPGQCVPCSNVCEKTLPYNSVTPAEQCPAPNAGLDEASTTCSATP